MKSTKKKKIERCRPKKNPAGLWIGWTPYPLTPIRPLRPLKRAPTPGSVRMRDQSPGRALDRMDAIPIGAHPFTSPIKASTHRSSWGLSAAGGNANACSSRALAPACSGSSWGLSAAGGNENACSSRGLQAGAAEGWALPEAARTDAHRARTLPLAAGAAEG